MSEFALYPVEQHWWSFNDYRAVVAIVRETQATTVLEFGPGSSTLALIEGGATRIDTCEDDEHWAGVHEARLVSRFPTVVTLHRYRWQRVLSLPRVDTTVYDLAFIDGPAQTPRRVAVLDYCLERARVVVVPMEDSLPLIRRLETIGETHALEVRHTGPLAGKMAILRSKEPAC